MIENQKLNGNAAAQRDSSSRLRESQSELLSELGAMRTKRNVKASNAKMISILHKCPCRLKCLHDITTSEYNNNILDRLYTEKHDTVKKRIIEAIVRRFSGKLKISSESRINNGTADISISSEEIIRLNNGKRIGIEVKSGQSIDLFQMFASSLHMRICAFPQVRVLLLACSRLNGQSSTMQDSINNNGIYNNQPTTEFFSLPLFSTLLCLTLVCWGYPQSITAAIPRRAVKAFLSFRPFRSRPPFPTARVISETFTITLPHIQQITYSETHMCGKICCIEC